MWIFVRVVDLIDMLPHKGTHCCPGGYDLHFWLSPFDKVKVQARNISNALIATFPQYRDEYTANLNAFLNELDSLNSQIKQS